MSNLKGYGYVDDSSEELKSKSRGTFGGNFGVCQITQFEYKENVAKEGNEPREAIELVIKIKDNENKYWISPIDKIFIFENGARTEITEDHPDYESNFNAQMVQQNAVTTHILKALGVSEDTLKNTLSQGFANFKAYAQAIIGILPTGFEKKPLDVFQEYQWKIGKKADGSLNDKTYPQIPKNMKGGYFIVPAQKGQWKEVRGDDGSLTYVNAEGQTHPFVKDASFMESNKGTQQFLNTPEDTGSSAMAEGQAKSVDWGAS